VSVDFSLVEALVKARLEAAGAAAAAYLKDALSQEGSGTQHPGLPNRSSSPEEYPAGQSMALAESIASQPGPGLSVTVGALIDPPPEALSLLLKPPGAGGRDWLGKAFHDPDLHQAALEGARKL
jgi:hypothetical protein